jgi:hypothetical protein
MIFFGGDPDHAEEGDPEFGQTLNTFLEDEIGEFANGYGPDGHERLRLLRDVLRQNADYIDQILAGESGVQS